MQLNQKILCFKIIHPVKGKTAWQVYLKKSFKLRIMTACLSIDVQNKARVPSYFWAKCILMQIFVSLKKIKLHHYCGLQKVFVFWSCLTFQNLLQRKFSRFPQNSTKFSTLTHSFWFFLYLSIIVQYSQLFQHISTILKYILKIFPKK